MKQSHGQSASQPLFADGQSRARGWIISFANRAKPMTARAMEKYVLARLFSFGVKIKIGDYYFQLYPVPYPLNAVAIFVSFTCQIWLIRLVLRNFKFYSDLYIINPV